MNTIVVTGDRRWGHRRRMEAVLTGLRDGGVERLVHGKCPTGADKLADEIGRALGLEVIAVPADWSIGRGGGPVRNRKMLDTYTPNLVVAFHDDLARSKGTKDCVKAALQRNIPVMWWTRVNVVTLDSLVALKPWLN